MSPRISLKLYVVLTRNLQIVLQSKSSKSYENDHYPFGRNLAVQKGTMRFSVNIPRIHYGGILYDKGNNEYFQIKMEKPYYRAFLLLTGGIQGTSIERLYDKLGLHPLVKRRLHNELVFFYKIVSCLLSDSIYLYS